MKADDILSASNLQTVNPETLFDAWLESAKACPNIREPTAMILATVSADLQPSARTVLLKGHDKNGFLFFTNSDSRKGREMAANPKVALTFYWDALFRQVHIRGPVSQADHSVAMTYWKTRHRESQLSQWLSHQSEPLAPGQTLDKLLSEARQQWEGQDVPCPEHWDGFYVQPREFEFWLGDQHRLHRRFVFLKQPDRSWSAQQCFP
jgi:pyridoxamine 5'-phosphate oxidase